MASTSETREDYRSLRNRVNTVIEKNKSDKQTFQTCFINIGGQILKVQKDYLKFGGLVNDVTQRVIPIIRDSEEEFTRGTQLLTHSLVQTTRAQTRVRARIIEPPMEDLDVTCPHHPDQRIIFRVPKAVHIGANGVPIELYSCPLKLSQNCETELLRGDWKRHIKKTCLPHMNCRRSNHPDEDCGPE